MKKIKLVFVMLALIGLCSAFISKTSSSILLRKYRIAFFVDYKLYVEDITNLTNGFDYECNTNEDICSFITLGIPFYDPDNGWYYFNPSILWLCIDREDGEFVDLRY